VVGGGGGGGWGGGGGGDFLTWKKPLVFESIRGARLSGLFATVVSYQ